MLHEPRGLQPVFYTRTVTGLLRGDPDAQVGGPTAPSAASFLVEGLTAHCATQGAPLRFLSWHLYSDSPAAHAGNIANQRARLAKFAQLEPVKLFISEWNTMPPYSTLFDHHGRVRPARCAFRLLGQLEGPRCAVDGEEGNIRAIAGEGNGYKHLIVWRYEDGGPDEIE